MKFLKKLFRKKDKVHKCPDCGNTEFLFGPSGGLCVNVKCMECGSKYNYTNVFCTLERI